MYALITKEDFIVAVEWAYRCGKRIPDYQFDKAVQLIIKEMRWHEK